MLFTVYQEEQVYFQINILHDVYNCMHNEKWTRTAESFIYLINGKTVLYIISNRAVSKIYVYSIFQIHWRNTTIWSSVCCKIPRQIILLFSFQIGSYPLDTYWSAEGITRKSKIPVRVAISDDQSFFSNRNKTLKKLWCYGDLVSTLSSPVK